MEYTLIQGIHDGPHPLLYSHDEKRLYHFTNDRSGRIEYTCYDHLLRQEYKSSIGAHLKCTARAMLQNNDCMRNGIAHKCDHNHNHELAFRDLQTLNAVREKCRLLSEWCPLSASKVSAKELLAIELAK